MEIRKEAASVRTRQRILISCVRSALLLAGGGLLFGCLADGGSEHIDVRWIEGAPVTAESARFIDGMGLEVNWSGTRDADTVTVLASFLCGDECGGRYEIILVSETGE